MPTDTLIFDGHNDVLLSLTETGRSFFERSDRGHIDLPRAKAGGYAGGLFAVFVSDDPAIAKPLAERVTPTADGYTSALSPAVGLDRAQTAALAQVASLFRLEAAAAGELKIVRTLDQLDRCLADGTLAVVLHFEGAEPIDPDLNALEVFHAAGLRSLGLVWSRPNAFAEGVPFCYPASPDTGPGLTDAGRALVRECNRLGVVVDLAHINERGFWDVARLTDRPLVVSHSGAHALCPMPRNLTDAQLDAIGESGGLIGVFLMSNALRRDGRYDVPASIGDFVDHVDYIARRIGVEHGAFGTDFDGTRVPSDVGDVSVLPRIVSALRERGYDDAALALIARDNWLRVLGQTWRS